MNLKGKKTNSIKRVSGFQAWGENTLTLKEIEQNHFDISPIVDLTCGTYNRQTHRGRDWNTRFQGLRKAGLGSEFINGDKLI